MDSIYIDYFSHINQEESINHLILKFQKVIRIIFITKVQVNRIRRKNEIGQLMLKLNIMVYLVFILEITQKIQSIFIPYRKV